MCVDGFPSDDVLLYCPMRPFNNQLIVLRLGYRQRLGLSLSSGSQA